MVVAQLVERALLRFESRHRQLLYYLCGVISIEKAKLKKKRPGRAGYGLHPWKAYLDIGISMMDDLAKPFQRQQLVDLIKNILHSYLSKKQVLSVWFTTLWFIHNCLVLQLNIS